MNLSRYAIVAGEFTGKTVKGDMEFISMEMEYKSKATFSYTVYQHKKY